MGRPARVKSIDALQAMSAALHCFHDDAASALDDLEIEIRRALQWINHDCRDYWKMELRKSQDNVTDARNQLQHAMIYRRIDEEQRASCVEEKKALERAKRRLQTAEGIIAALPHWTVAIERAVNEYRGARSQFGNWLDADYPRAVAALSRMSSALETYVRLGAPVDEHSPIDRASMTSTDDAKAADAPDKTNEQVSETIDPNAEQATP